MMISLIVYLVAFAESITQLQKNRILINPLNQIKQKKNNDQINHDIYTLKKMVNPNHYINDEQLSIFTQESYLPIKKINQLDDQLKNLSNIKKNNQLQNDDNQFIHYLDVENNSFEQYLSPDKHNNLNFVNNNIPNILTTDQSVLLNNIDTDIIQQTQDHNINTNIIQQTQDHNINTDIIQQTQDHNINTDIIQQTQDHNINTDIIQQTQDHNINTNIIQQTQDENNNIYSPSYGNQQITNLYNYIDQVYNIQYHITNNIQKYFIKHPNKLQKLKVIERCKQHDLEQEHERKQQQLFYQLINDINCKQRQLFQINDLIENHISKITKKQLSEAIQISMSLDDDLWTLQQYYNTNQYLPILNTPNDQNNIIYNVNNQYLRDQTNNAYNINYFMSNNKINSTDFEQPNNEEGINNQQLQKFKKKVSYNKNIYQNLLNNKKQRKAPQLDKIDNFLEQKYLNQRKMLQYLPFNNQQLNIDRNRPINKNIAQKGITQNNSFNDSNHSIDKNIKPTNITQNNSFNDSNHSIDKNIEQKDITQKHNLNDSINKNIKPKILIQKQKKLHKTKPQIQNKKSKKFICGSDHCILF